MSENGKYGGEEYNTFLEEADRDDRIGDHDFMITDVKVGTWRDLTPAGSNDPVIKVYGVLLTANRADVDLTWSPPPSASVLKSEGSTYDSGKKKAIASALRIARELSKHYGKGDPSDLAPGDVVRVKTVKTKVKADGRGGFIRIIAVLPPVDGQAVAADAPAF